MKIELPDGQPNRNNNHKKVKKVKTKPKKRKKILPENIRWRDNGDTISAKIGNQIIYIDKYSCDIQLKNGFIIKCRNMEDAKNKAILLFNN